MHSVEALYKCRRIVAIGGGHGLGKVMASLGFLKDRLTGIVATTDDGGSTGRLREMSDCIAWGDLRNCLNQLCADSPNLSRILFEYRFKEDSGDLSHHNLGNLIFLAMDQMCVRPLDAVNLIRQILQVETQLIPMSEQPASLAGIINGEQVVGETTIDGLEVTPEKLMLIPEIKPTKEAIEAIEEADVIILGPGSFMTSVLPALLMEDVSQAILNSTAKKIFVGNINPEISPVRKMAIREKLDWLQSMTGVYPDILLWPSERSLPSGIKCEIRYEPLTDAIQTGAHSKKGLRKALDKIAAEFI
ncbi:hypothetical protein EOPP23_04140 [Endozoicomonas sp. OPT23]|uniref:gluconeogenesis factor YvcK family protein n=1 Tax=Endozoicomonas sp. OPT23 TaxID=2072845 RepID=UPI00129B77FF|nr:uridine diphosphate-N-acetylglucosamine-binding protein YvcK [Endozoicomonas sp. OPT23]MRI32186.1 hypothetical protein [Endozoicomonas sp. OPT23]